MKKTVLAAAAAMICPNLVADMISLFGSNVEVHARSAASVTGPQAAVIASALQPEATNGWTVTAHQNWLTSEVDAAALARIDVHTNRFDNPHTVTAAQVGAPSIEELYTLMATSRIERVWEGTNAWYTFASNTVTRWCTSPVTRWVINLPIDIYDVEGGTLLQAATNVISDAPYPITEAGSWVGIQVETDGAGIGLSAPFNLVWGYGGSSVLPVTGTVNIPQLYGWPEIGIVYVIPIAMIDTNTTTYYLPTNPAPSETWSRTDMDSWQATNQYVYASWYAYQTNWMADGNAGQLWVTDLAASTTALMTMPSASNLYANLAVTNTAGYASFSTANPVSQQTVTVIPASTIATNSVSLRYDVGSDGFISAQAVTHARVGSGIESMSSTLTLWNYLGEPLASNVFYGVWSGSIMFLPYFTNNLVWTGSFLTNAYLTLTCTMSKTNTSSAECGIAAGGTVPSTLAVTTTPLPYTTPEQLQTSVANVSSGTGGATNLVLNGVQQTYDEATRTFTGTVEGGSGTTPAHVTNIVAGLATTNRLWYTMPWNGAAYSAAWVDGGAMNVGQTNSTAFSWTAPAYDISCPITCRMTHYNNGGAGGATTNIVFLALYYSSAVNTSRIIGGWQNSLVGSTNVQWTYRPQASDSWLYALRIISVNNGTTNGLVSRCYNNMRWSPATAEEISAAGL